MELNQNLWNGYDTGKIWRTGVGSDTALSDGSLVHQDLAVRRIVVGNIVGPLTLVSYLAGEITYDAGHLYALNGVLDGQWVAVLAESSSGVVSTSYNLIWIR